MKRVFAVAAIAAALFAIPSSVAATGPASYGGADFDSAIYDGGDTRHQY